jgi:hypothetical protein
MQAVDPPAHETADIPVVSAGKLCSTRPEEVPSSSSGDLEELCPDNKQNSWEGHDAASSISVPLGSIESSLVKVDPPSPVVAR